MNCFYSKGWILNCVKVYIRLISYDFMQKGEKKETQRRMHEEFNTYIRSCTSN